MDWDAFVEQVKNFGVANWVIIGSLILMLLLLIIIVIVNIKIMGKYRKDMMKTRVARLVPKIEVIDGWCCLSVENKGQDIATNVKLNLKGSIIKYYRNYITKCRLDDVLGKTMDKGFMLVAGDKKTVRLFPIKTVNENISLIESRTRIKVAGDLDFTGNTEHKDEMEVVESFGIDDEKILKSVEKEQNKLLKLHQKQQKKYNKKENKLNVKRQKAILKYNKKNNKLTHTSVVAQPDMTKLIKGADLYIKLEYECLGYLMKYNFKYKNIDLRAFPEELNSVRTVLTTQNALMEEMILLQNDVRAMLGGELVKFEDLNRSKEVSAVMDEPTKYEDIEKPAKEKKEKREKPKKESKKNDKKESKKNDKKDEKNEPKTDSIPVIEEETIPVVESVVGEEPVVDTPSVEAESTVDAVEPTPVVESEEAIVEDVDIEEDIVEDVNVEENIVEDAIENLTTDDITALAEEISIPEEQIEDTESSELDNDFDEFIPVEEDPLA